MQCGRAGEWKAQCDTQLSLHRRRYRHLGDDHSVVSDQFCVKIQQNRRTSAMLTVLGMPCLLLLDIAAPARIAAPMNGTFAPHPNSVRDGLPPSQHGKTLIAWQSCNIFKLQHGPGLTMITALPGCRACHHLDALAPSVAILAMEDCYERVKYSPVSTKSSSEMFTL